MAHLILSLWLLAAQLGPHAYDQRAAAQETHPTPGNLSASSTYLNNHHFAFNLYRQLVVQNPETNVLFSPLSFSVPLTLLALQAKPEARTQILQDLGFGPAGVPNEQAHVHYGRLLAALLPPPGECQTDTGSVLFLGHRINTVKKFVQIAKNLFSTEISPISFRSSHVAKNQIDLAMQKRTQGKIKDLFQEAKLRPTLILANYMFFKGKWKYRFNPRDTALRPFLVSKGRSVLVPTMQRQGWFELQYFYHLYSHVLRLPCGCNTTALFILPKEDKVAEAEEALTKDASDTWTQPFPLSKRKLYFPKFSLTGNTELDQLVLSPDSLNVFSYNTDFSGISVQAIPMMISKAAHRVELTLDEEGAEEEDVSSFKALPKHQVPEFHFNRPFLLLIFEEGSHNVLFMGKVIHPKAKS